ncbi:hypothetical protein HELRODRAFT_183616 [Helobdella robusta]|uniref:Uncharacterized protein n=1 Tax=Helobdella robusta TaxID=6412 RepID=T1FJX8_HELRO|nr:hypothetical protein HELRODRAFT_183616 [Helobdella robusta]ESO10459.1 hypothetical protein HELRODRAFT_183616 [Helobdella robusta]
MRLWVQYGLHGQMITHMGVLWAQCGIYVYRKAYIGSTKVFFFGDFGGRKLDEVIRRVMSHIMKNDVALGFNMVEKKGKMPFGSSKLFEIVYMNSGPAPAARTPTQPQTNEVMSLVVDQLQTMKNMMSSMMDDMSSLKGRLNKIEGKMVDEPIVPISMNDDDTNSIYGTPRVSTLKNRTERRKRNDDEIDEVACQINTNKKRVTVQGKNDKNDKGVMGTKDVKVTSDTRLTQEEFDKEVEGNHERHMNIMARFACGLYGEEYVNGNREGFLTDRELRYAQTHTTGSK